MVTVFWYEDVFREITGCTNDPKCAFWTIQLNFQCKCQGSCFEKC